jgi:hypothetical protein
MKNKYILTGLHGRPSTKLAFSTMESESLLVQRRILPNKTYYRVFKDRETLRQKLETFSKYLFEFKEPNLILENSVVVRWGTREQLPTDKSTVVYNKIAAIANATDKARSRELFIEHGVSCPKLITPENIVIEDFPIIARPLVHSKGKNFDVIKTVEEYEEHYKEGWYYSNFIDKDREFRVHVAHGKVLALMEKPKPAEEMMAWNRALNADEDPFIYVKWDDIDKQNLKNVLVEGINAAKALGLDFGGIDVMLKGNKAYVLEANTAPTLNSSPYVASRWGMYFDWLFRKETRRAHWMGTTTKQYGKSMIWKNFQLHDRQQ